MNRLNTTAAAVASFLGAAYVVAWIAKPKLQYFTSAEFGVWWPLMSHEWLRKIDVLRDLWGKPIHISPAEGGLGRADGSGSQHDILSPPYGVVNAGDVFIDGHGPNGTLTLDDRIELKRLAERVGFTGIGFYFDTVYGDADRDGDADERVMMHLDVREGQPGQFLWSRVDGDYTSINQAIS